MEGSNCPQCGSSSISVTETTTSVTHKCNSCGYSETQRKHHRRRSLVNLACLVAAVLVYAALMTSIFLAAAAQPAQP